jgi:hypothetical protein
MMQGHCAKQHQACFDNAVKIAGTTKTQKNFVPV